MTRIVSMASLVAAFMCLTTFGYAQPGEPDSRSRGGDGERRQRLLEEFDADDDGQLSEEERQRAREVMRDRRRDGGGPAFDGRGPRREQFRRGARDGRPGEGGLRARRPGPPEGRGRLDGPPRGAARGPARFIDPRELFDQFDENNDDQLSREEFLSLSVEVMKIRSERLAHLGPPAGRGPGPRGWRDDRPYPARLGRPDGRQPDRPGRRLERRDRPAPEESVGVGGDERPTTDPAI